MSYRLETTICTVGYNLQAAICDEYIAVIDVKPYASDMVPIIIISTVKNMAWKNT